MYVSSCASLVRTSRIVTVVVVARLGGGD